MFYNKQINSCISKVTNCKTDSILTNLEFSSESPFWQDWRVNINMTNFLTSFVKVDTHMTWDGVVQIEHKLTTLFISKEKRKLL